LLCYNGNILLEYKKVAMKLRVFVLTLVTLIILSACKLSQSVQPGTHTPPPVTTQATGSTAAPATEAAGSLSTAGNPLNDILAAASSPINLTTTLDTNHLAEAVIPIKGGQLQATGADGTLYTLDIPADSLVKDTKIRMTPVSSISGLPFGGAQSYAVKLDPEGLFLYKDAILTIAPSQPITLESQLFFGYHGDGQNMILAAPVSDSMDMKIRLIHFSGYGVAEVDINNMPDQQNQLGADTLDRIQSLVAKYLEEERIRQRSRVEDTLLTPDRLVDLIDQYEEQVVKPALQAAGDSCEAGKTAIAALVELERTRQLLGITSAGIFNADLIDLISKVSQVCVREAYQECVDKHIIYKMIPLWIGLMRQNELLGGDNRNGPQPEEIKLAEELTTKCLTFELQFTSQGSFEPGGGGYKSEVKAVVRLQFDPINIIIKGEAPLDSVSFEFTPPAGCTATSTPGGGTFTTIGLAYVTDNHAFDDESEYVRDFKLVYWPGVTTESYHVDCPPGGPSQQESHYTSPPSGYWSGIFFTLHSQELNAGGDTGQAGSGGVPAMPDLSGLLAGADAGAMPAFPAPAMQDGSGFYLDGWEVPGGELFASHEWIKNDSGLGLTESGTFKLYHKPGQ
jgi:hypothetical protein